MDGGCCLLWLAGQRANGALLFFDLKYRTVCQCAQMQKELGTTRIVDGWGKSFSLGEKLCPSIRLLGKLLRGTT
jgi:hypothetical protein